MKLIKEASTYLTKFIKEDVDGGGLNYYIEGVFLQSNIVNRNGRIYPASVMDPEVARYIAESVDTNRAYGELGHPDTPDINLDRVSHMVVSLTKVNDNYVGRAKILQTPMGKIVCGLLEGGASLGVSSRALGSLREGENGVDIVQPDFRLFAAADIVADPSAPDAFVQGILEHKEWIFEKDHYVERDINLAENRIRAAKPRSVKAVSISEFKRFLGQIN